MKTSLRAIRKLSIVAASIAVGAAVLAMSVTAATAAGLSRAVNSEVAATRIVMIKDYDGNDCVDSDGRRVYYNACDTSNGWMKWYMVDMGNGQHRFHHYQSLSDGKAKCMVGYAGKVYVEDCRDSENNRYYRWKKSGNGVYVNAGASGYLTAGGNGEIYLARLGAGSQVWDIVAA